MEKEKRNVHLSKKVGEKMSFLQRVSQRFDTSAQTSDKHENQALVTRYYKTNVAQGLAAVKEIVVETQGYEVKSFQEERGEMGIIVQKPRGTLMIATVTMVRPFHTAIDFYVTTESRFAFKGSERAITYMYEALNKKLTYIGSGME